MRLQNLEDLLILKLKALFDIESEIIKALPKMIKKAAHPGLKVAFTEHLKITKDQLVRLRKAFTKLGKKPQKTKGEGIRGIIDDTKWLMNENMPSEAMDASLIATAQYIEHYEIAGYGTAAAWADELRQHALADLLREILKEEKEADMRLTRLALGVMNEEAMDGLIAAK